MASLFSEKYMHRDANITQHLGAAKTAQFERLDALIILLPERPATSVWSRLPQGNKLKSLLNRRGADAVPAVVSRLGNKKQTTVLLACVKKDADTFEQLSLARKLVAGATDEKPKSIGVLATGFSADSQSEIVANATAAILAAAFRMPRFESKDKAKPPIFTRIHLLDLQQKIDTTRLLAEADGNNFTRWLTAMPANKLDAVEYVKITRELAKDNNWQFKKYGVRELEKLGAGAFLAVARGNDDDSAAIVRLKYRPGKKSEKAALSLVGKGIIFDTGGTNLKPFNSMLEMHTDMGGSAVALATFRAISKLGLPIAVDCWLAITENRTGPLAYKSQDILVAANGKTIQTIHTDAEGRLALADTLVLASREKPGMIIDYATLTGACVVGISERYSGVFSNRTKLHPVLKRAGRKSGERVWPFPMGDEFLERLKSDTADLRQCAVSGGGDHIYAATFLREFVDKNIPWIHVDLSACTHKGGLAHIPTLVTGFGVRFSLNFLLDQGALEHA